MSRLLLDALAEAPPVQDASPASGDGTYWPASKEGLAVCGLAAWIAALISMFQIFQHIMNYEDPVIQRYYIRIIFVIPNYALCSFFSLAFPGASLYIETVRDMYEAFVIYSFMSLLLEYIGGPGRVEAVCRDTVVYGSWLHGTCCLPPMQVDGQFVKLCKRAVLQFVVLKPVLVILTIVLYAKDNYKDGYWAPDSSYMYIQIVYNFTYGLALLGLIHFWSGARELLKPYKPVMKFVTVKGVVFVTFWQGMILSLVLMDRPDQDAQQLQTWLLCIEMLPFALMMWFAFPATQYMSAARNRQAGGIMMAVQNVGNVVMFTDVVTDFKHQFKPQYNTYTCYKDMGDAEEGTPAPSGSYRHATYLMKDPFQEQAIAEHAHHHEQAMTAATEGVGTSRATPLPVADFLGADLDDVPLDDDNGRTVPQ